MRPARVPTEYSDRVEEAQHGWLPTHSDGGGATSQQSAEAFRYQQFSGGAISPSLWLHVRFAKPPILTTTTAEAPRSRRTVL